VDVCIATCRRPRGLARLLGALAQLRLPDPAPELRAVVVDNDREASARAVCDAALDALPFPLVYAIEKRRGIPQARNAALALSLRGADFAAFLDDDEVPEPDWLAELLAAQAASGADAVVGPVVRAFEAPVPQWRSGSSTAGCSRCIATPRGPASRPDTRETRSCPCPRSRAWTRCSTSASR
jgi:GT2 family glycosyltransferase